MVALSSLLLYWSVSSWVGVGWHGTSYFAVHFLLPLSNNTFCLISVGSVYRDWHHCDFLCVHSLTSLKSKTPFHWRDPSSHSMSYFHIWIVSLIANVQNSAYGSSCRWSVSCLNLIDRQGFYPKCLRKEKSKLLGEKNKQVIQYVSLHPSKPISAGCKKGPQSHI